MIYQVVEGLYTHQVYRPCGLEKNVKGRRRALCLRTDASFLATTNPETKTGRTTSMASESPNILLRPTQTSFPPPGMESIDFSELLSVGTSPLRDAQFSLDLSSSSKSQLKWPNKRSKESQNLRAHWLFRRCERNRLRWASSILRRQCPRRLLQPQST